MSQSMSISSGQRFSLPLYLLLVYGLSWPFLIASAIWANEDLVLRLALNVAGMIMVGIGTFIAGRYIFRDGFAGSGWRWSRGWYYLAVIGLALLFYAVPTIFDVTLGTIQLPPGISSQQLILIFPYLALGLIGAFGEEFAWRGYMWPRIARRSSVRKAVLLQGLIWWSWHLPIMIGPAIFAGRTAAEPSGLDVTTSVVITVLTAVIMSVLPVVLHGVLIAYIWTRSQSLAVATVYHAAHNGTRDSIGLLLGLGPIAGIWANVAIMLLGILCLWKGDWSALKQSSDTSVVPTTPEAISYTVPEARNTNVL